MLRRPSLTVSMCIAAAAIPTAAFAQLGPPPRAAAVEGEVQTVLLAAPFAKGFMCSEHAFDEVPYAGDALGTDCLVVSDIADGSGFRKQYRTDGSTNEDWFGWGEPVRAPADATVLGILQRSETNIPGQMGRPPASLIRFQTADGVVIVYGHVADITVKAGDVVRAGDVVARVGNDGVSRSPHLHVGAYRVADSMPLQIRWDQRTFGP